MFEVRVVDAYLPYVMNFGTPPTALTDYGIIILIVAVCY